MKNKFFSLLFTIVIGMGTILASDTQVDGIWYKLDSKTKEASVTYKGSNYDTYSNEYNGSITIPSSVVYNNVTYNVTSIGYAFYGCTGLTSVTIPNSVTSIGDYAFKGCTGLTSVIIPNSVTRIGSYAFYGCTGLTSVTIPNSVTSIGDYAFSSCRGFTSVIIPNSVTSIGYAAFSGCTSLTSVTIPNSVTSIGYAAFNGCTGLTEVHISDIAAWCNIAFSDYMANPLYNAKHLYLNDTEITELVIPNSVTSIGSYAFQNCSGLASVTIPNSVTSIGNNAFSGCTSLTEVHISDIAAWCNIAFSSSSANPLYNAKHLYLNDTEITELVIPNSVTSIGSYAFQNCSGLASVTIPNSVTSIGSYAFQNCSDLTSVIIGNSVTIIGEYAFYKCSALTSVIIPNSVTSIGYAAFSGCTGLTSVTVPNSVTSIGDLAFSGCRGLTSVIIPNSVTSIGDYAFSNCRGLTSVIIPNSVTRIGKNAFNDCSNLTSIVWNAQNPFFPITNETLGPFYNIRTQITSFVFGDAVDSIPEYLCYGMTKLTSITIPNSVTYIGENSFSGCSGLTSVVWNAQNFPSPSTETSAPFYNIRTQITSFVFGDAVGRIQNYLCNGMTKLTSITIPNSVTSIGMSAFKYCYYLNVVYIGNSVISIGKEAFYNCPQLYKIIMLPNSVPSGINTAFQLLSGRISYVGNTNYQSGYDVLGTQRVYSNLNSYFSVDGIVYALVNPSKRTCDIIDCDYSGATTEFAICNSVVYHNIALTVDSININAFRNNKNMKKLVIDYNHALPPYMASGCSSLHKVRFGNNITSIGLSAFENCVLIDSVILPNSVTALGNSVFYNCSNLAYVKLGNTVSSIGTSAFALCASLPEIFIPKSVNYIGETAFDECSSLAVVGFEDGANALTLGKNAANQGLFYDCPLDSVYVGRELTYPQSASDGYSPFYRNATLRSIVMSNIPTKVETNEFYGCTHLYSVFIGNGVQSIGDYAFSGCSSIDYFRFGHQVQTIGAEAFSDCVAMTKLYSYCQTPPTCGTSALEDIDKWNCTLYIPKGTKAAYTTAAQWKDFFFIEENNEKFAITWKNDDGSIIDTTEIAYGQLPNHTIPEKSATAQYIYTFAGWTPEITAATCNATYTATYTSSLRTYTVTFLDKDGSTLSAQLWNYGAVPTCDEPIKPADAQYTYTFAGWSPNVIAVTGDTTYTATYNASVRSYTISFKNGDNVLQSTEVEYGVTPTYIITTPTKPATAQYTYTFKGWSPNIVAVIGDATYTATFDSIVNKYTIKFMNGDQELQSTEVEYGQVPAYTGAPPTKPADAQNTYTFVGWTPEIVTVSGNATYTAVFSSTVNSYTITWKQDDSSTIDQTIVAYGQMPTHANPTKQATAEFIYTFAGWSPNVVAVAGDAEYIAIYSATRNSYTITWKSDDGSTIDQTTVEYGQIPAHANPSKQATAQYTYTFSGWTPNVVAVTEGATYTAVFSSTVNSYTITWKQDDGSTIDQTTVEYGQIPAHANPSKLTTAEFTYTFAGWSPEVAAVTEDITYTATYTAIRNSYTITWKNEDGSVIDQTLVEYGQTPTHAEPTKADDEQYTYTFAGWSPEVVAVTGDVTYTATFSSLLRKYMITFLDEDGTVLSAQEWEYGTMPTCTEPTKADDEQYTYTFAGWSPEVVAVTGDVTYTATFSSLLRKYMITFLDEDGTVLSAQEWEYGTMPTCTEPTKADDEQYTYTFAGWTPEVVAVAGEATYTASYTATKKPEGFEDVPSEPAPQKVMIDGTIYILRGDKTYTLQGQEVK